MWLTLLNNIWLDMYSKFVYKSGIRTRNTSETVGYPAANMESQVYSSRNKSVLYYLATS